MLYRPDILPLSLEVADDATGTYMQKIHQVDVFVPIGGTGLIRLDAYVTAYTRTAAGGYGEALPADRVPVRKVALIAVPTCAVEPSGRVRFRVLVPGRVRDMVSGEETTLAAGQTFEQFLDAHPDTLLLQNEAMAFQRDNEPLCLRAFAESHLRAADAAPSAFA